MVVFVPLCLLVMIAQARNWARMTAMVFYLADLLFRIYLASFDADPAGALAWTIGPALLQVVAFVLLYAPRSNAWFGAPPA